MTDLGYVSPAPLHTLTEHARRGRRRSEEVCLRQHFIRQGLGGFAVQVVQFVCDSIRDLLWPVVVQVGVVEHSGSGNPP